MVKKEAEKKTQSKFAAFVGDVGADYPMSRGDVVLLLNLNPSQVEHAVHKNELQVLFSDGREIATAGRVLEWLKKYEIPHELNTKIADVILDATADEVIIRDTYDMQSDVAPYIGANLAPSVVRKWKKTLQAGLNNIPPDKLLAAIEVNGFRLLPTAEEAAAIYLRRQAAAQQAAEAEEAASREPEDLDAILADIEREKIEAEAFDRKQRRNTECAYSDDLKRIVRGEKLTKSEQDNFRGIVSFLELTPDDLRHDREQLVKYFEQEKLTGDVRRLQRKCEQARAKLDGTVDRHKKELEAAKASWRVAHREQTDAARAKSEIRTLEARNPRLFGGDVDTQVAPASKTAPAQKEASTQTAKPVSRSAQSDSAGDDGGRFPAVI